MRLREEEQRITLPEIRFLKLLKKTLKSVTLRRFKPRKLKKPRLRLPLLPSKLQLLRPLLKSRLVLRARSDT